MNKEQELEFLMNPVLYDKYQQLSCKEHKQHFLLDKKFYRKRIQDMAKNCAKVGIVKDIPPQNETILQVFNYFAATCIDHFKLIDETECYQNEYNDLVLNNENDANSSDNTNSSDNANDILFASNISEKKVISMDDFVTRKNVRQSNKKNHFPKQKIANVKEKKYRTKGIKKNKSNPIINNEKGIV